MPIKVRKNLATDGSSRPAPAQVYSIITLKAFQKTDSACNSHMSCFYEVARGFLGVLAAAAVINIGDKQHNTTTMGKRSNFMNPHYQDCGEVTAFKRLLDDVKDIRDDVASVNGCLRRVRQEFRIPIRNVFAFLVYEVETLLSRERESLTSARPQGRAECVLYALVNIRKMALRSFRSLASESWFEDEARLASVVTQVFVAAGFSSVRLHAFSSYPPTSFPCSPGGSGSGGGNVSSAAPVAALPGAHDRDIHSSGMSPPPSSSPSRSPPPSYSPPRSAPAYSATVHDVSIGGAPPPPPPPPYDGLFVTPTLPAQVTPVRQYLPIAPSPIEAATSQRTIPLPQLLSHRPSYANLGVSGGGQAIVYVGSPPPLSPERSPSQFRLSSAGAGAGAGGGGGGQANLYGSTSRAFSPERSPSQSRLSSAGAGAGGGGGEANLYGSTSRAFSPERIPSQSHLSSPGANEYPRFEFNGVRFVRKGDRDEDLDGYNTSSMTLDVDAGATAPQASSTTRFVSAGSSCLQQLFPLPDNNNNNNNSNNTAFEHVNDFNGLSTQGTVQSPLNLPGGDQYRSLNRILYDHSDLYVVNSTSVVERSFNGGDYGENSFYPLFNNQLFDGGV